jgi:redox-sensitive bicupin YhaK (pirin superfamily)
MTILVSPRVHDLGGFQVRRAVPSLQARSVGPFVFVDHMGPALFEPGRGIDVRPHPHIGLATVTYLWAGALRHRDTLGSVQDILPGDVNWMTAGRGIAHSERTPPDTRASGHPVHGMQTWVALPKPDEDIAPSFHHHSAASLPLREHAGARLRVVAGRGFGMESPVQVFADTFNVAVDLAADAELAIAPEAGPVWPMKKWAHYDRLKAELERRGLRVNVLPKRPTLLDHLDRIPGARVDGEVFLPGLFR